MNANRNERRQRVAIIRRILRFPEMIEDIHQDMGRLRLDKAPVSKDKLQHVDDKMREAINYTPRFKSELRVLFNSTNPTEDTSQRFDEVYGAFERETTACFQGLQQLKMYLHRALELPVKGGETYSVSFRTVYGVIDIDEPKRILKMAAKEIAQCFPVDEAEEAAHAAAPIIEEYIVGDKFENITNSTIVNRSHVEHAFHRTEARLGDEVASAIVEIAQLIDQSGNAAARRRRTRRPTRRAGRQTARSVWAGSFSRYRHMRRLRTCWPVGGPNSRLAISGMLAHRGVQAGSEARAGQVPRGIYSGSGAR